MNYRDVLAGQSPFSVDCCDAIDFAACLPDDSVDLVITSPPYELARLYLEGGKNIGIARKTEAWVAWMVEVVRAYSRVCKGLMAFVVEGQTKSYQYSAGPALLMADLHRAGFNLRKPPVFHRVGIPGSGGPDWLRNDWEWIVSISRAGRLPWSENTAMGSPPKWVPGGEMSYRNADGKRKTRVPKFGSKDGDLLPRGQKSVETTRELKTRGTYREGGRDISIGLGDGRQEQQQYIPPKIANPGNVIRCQVGGGLMGHKLAHENEAPFPESLCDFFIKSFCPPGGIVCDPFGGSGSSLASAVKNGRRGISCDIRQSQVELATKRIMTPQSPKSKPKPRKKLTDDFPLFSA